MAARIVVLIAAFVALAAAHSCMINPMQRGSADVNTIASPDCGLEEGPCGGREVAYPTQGYVIGEHTTVTFTKNVNHYYATAPGNFTTQISQGNHENYWFTLYSQTDDDLPNQTFYTANITLPTHLYDGPAVIRTVYYPNNPAAGAAYYSCGDIFLISQRA